MELHHPPAVTNHPSTLHCSGGCPLCSTIHATTALFWASESCCFSWGVSASHQGKQRPPQKYSRPCRADLHCPAGARSFSWFWVHLIAFLQDRVLQISLLIIFTQKKCLGLLFLGIKQQTEQSNQWGISISCIVMLKLLKSLNCSAVRERPS